ncbi:MAG: amidohydrolase family protein [candidate division Zixibacteria bacterium]|nr:amidohydrolase family protein [candidate division Zixibacteria bacterium]
MSTTGGKNDVEADKIFKARAIITAPGGADAEFLAVRRGRVVATGNQAGGAAFERAGVPVVDFGDAAVLPGLWDAHVHLLLTGLALRQTDLSGARSLTDVFEVVREAAGGADEIAICGGLDETRLAEGRLPTGAELDAASPQKPVVVVRVDSHSLVINEAARRHLKVEASWPGVELDADGRPTGVLRGRANEMARTKIYNRVDAGTKATAYAEAAALAASRGVVALCALEGGRLFGEDDVPVLLACRDRLPLETFVFPQIPSATAARELGLPRLGGCILVDGSLGSWTAALTEPYADRPTTRGELYFAADDLNAVVLAAHATGLQVALHAIGDRAVTQVLDAYEIAAQEHPRADCRHRVEHAELAADRDLERAAKLGVTFSMQPAFEWYWGGPGKMYESRLGKRSRRTNRLRSALKAGVALAGGSDANITPLNPLLGIAAAMAHPNEGERLSFAEALAMFTTGAAAAAFAEDDWGTLEPGKRASFAVLPRDPRSLSPEEIAATEVVATVVRGEFTYRRGGEAAGGQEPRAAS